MNKLKKFLATLALLGLIVTNITTSTVLAADKIISKDAAKSAAFKQVGISKSEASSVKVEYDANDDDYGKVYEVEFTYGDYKYTYEIDANDSTVLKCEKKKLNTVKKSTSTSKYIGIKSAKSIALKHAKLKNSKVTFTKAKLTTDYGVKIYDIEFNTEDTEYDYEINAKTGKIIEFSSEPLDDDND